MAELKTIFDELLPDVKLKLRASAREYNTAKRLKYTLTNTNNIRNKFPTNPRQIYKHI